MIEVQYEAVQEVIANQHLAIKAVEEEYGKLVEAFRENGKIHEQTIRERDAALDLLEEAGEAKRFTPALRARCTDLVKQLRYPDPPEDDASRPLTVEEQLAALRAELEAGLAEINSSLAKKGKGK